MSPKPTTFGQHYAESLADKFEAIDSVVSVAIHNGDDGVWMHVTCADRIASSQVRKIAEQAPLWVEIKVTA